MGTLAIYNVLGMATRLKVPMLQASTSEVYGDPLEHPQTESYWGHVNPIGPRACYDEGKRAAETLFFDYHRQHGLDIRVVRLFNTFGPQMALDDGRVISNFIVAALQNKPISIYGDGSQTRSFCYVDDMVDGLINMMEQDDLMGPVNMGNPDEVSIKKLADEIIQLTDSDSEVTFETLPEDDPMQRKPDISLAKDRLNWEAKTDRSEGLRQTIDYFRKVIKS